MWTLIISGVCLLALIVLGALFYRQRRHQQGLFERLGIPGPKPHWWYGNYHQLLQQKRLLKLFVSQNGHEVLRKWTAEYGKTFGYYEGPTPILVTSDLDLLQDVFKTQFSNFNGRKLMPIQPDPDDSRSCMSMVLGRGDRWKRLRSIINPTFSMANLKQTLPLVRSKVEIMLEKLQDAADKGTPTDITPYLQEMTLDVMAEAAFGVHVNAQSSPAEPFLLKCREVFRLLEKKPLITHIAILLPWLRIPLWKLLLILLPLLKRPEYWLFRELSKVIAMRRQDGEGSGRKDLMQLMLNAESGSDNIWAQTTCWCNKDEDLYKETTNLKTATARGAGKTPMKSTEPKPRQKNKLTNEEIQRQSLVFLLAGYETTSTCLTFCCHLLASNPDKQNMLLEEIDRNIAPKEQVTYEKVHSLQYLDMVLMETLRMYPIASSSTNRVCVKTCVCAGITIPEGVTVQADVWSVHNDPEIWTTHHPTQFEPERFSKENRTMLPVMSMMAFGSGPRTCVGLRFALMEAKVALVGMLRKFSLAPLPQTSAQLKIIEGVTIRPKDGVHIKLVPRKNCEHV